MTAYAASLSLHPNAAEAVGETAGHVLEHVGPAPDIVLLFASPHHVDAFGDIVHGMHEILSPGVMTGSTAVGIAGGGREIEDAPALAVWAAHFEGQGKASSVCLRVEEAGGGVRVQGWPDDVPDGGTLLFVPDPFSFPVEEFLRLVNEHAPGLSVIGGVASAGMMPRTNRLSAGETVLDAGAVGILLDADVPVDTVVSQGCRPVGRALTVTRSERNVVRELAGQTPVERLRELAAGLDDGDRELMRNGLHVGLVVDEHRESFRRGDFLVRNLVGVDEETGAIAIGERVEVGQTLQFQVRDAASADADLRAMLRGVAARSAVLFTCNGRGSRLFGTPDHDVGVVEDVLGPIPLAGAFCAGELGPIGLQNHLHGFTASLAIFN
jgi:small ligand-binding sensory domain FIST